MIARTNRKCIPNLNFQDMFKVWKISKKTLVQVLLYLPLKKLAGKLYIRLCRANVEFKIASWNKIEIELSLVFQIPAKKVFFFLVGFWCPITSSLSVFGSLGYHHVVFFPVSTRIGLS